MAKFRQVILFASDPPAAGPSGAPGSGPGKMRPLGPRRDILKTLANFNTAPDGSRSGEGIAYGPGMVVQFPMSGGASDDVNQVLVAINEDEIAWAVLQNICRQTGWKLMDPDTGRVFGGPN